MRYCMCGVRDITVCAGLGLVFCQVAIGRVTVVMTWHGYISWPKLSIAINDVTVKANISQLHYKPARDPAKKIGTAVSKSAKESGAKLRRTPGADVFSPVSHKSLVWLNVLFRVFALQMMRLPGENHRGNAAVAFSDQHSPSS